MTAETSGRITRRRCLGRALAWGVAGAAWSPAHASAAPQRLVCLDWTIAETVLALGLPLAGLGDRQAYADWVGYPAPPAATQDVGLRVQPSREVIARLKPDLILSASLLASVTPLLEAIAPVRLLDFYGEDTPPWPRFEDRTRTLARWLGRSAEAEHWLVDANQRMAAHARSAPIQAHRQHPVLVMQFVDARSVRVYGASSVFGAALTQLGLRNAWTAPVSPWGSDTVALERLMALPATTLALVIPPLPRALPLQLRSSRLWNSLPFVRQRRVATLPRVWSFGALPSALRFADQVATAFSSAQTTAWSEVPVVTPGDDA